MKPKKFILKNKTRVIFIPYQSFTTTILILTKAGSLYENKKNNGISHFLEHLVFKGSKKRPSSFLITKELESLGASYNAFTSFEFTGYFAKVENRHFEKAIDILADLYLNPLLEEEEIEKEKGVVIEEINLEKDLPPKKIWSLFLKLLYPNHPAGFSILGDDKIIKKLRKQDILNYRKIHYTGESSIIAIAGGVSEKKVKEKITPFLSLNKGRKIKLSVPKTNQRQPRYYFFEKNIDQAHFILGFNLFNAFSRKKYAAKLLAEILGGGMSSRLFQLVREKLGAAYYIKSEVDLFSTHGMFTIFAGIDKNRIKEIIKLILKEIKLIKNKGITKEELERAKNFLLGNFWFSLENSEGIADFYALNELLFEKIISPKEIEKKIKKVSEKEINKLINEIFKDNNLNLAIISSDKQNLASILKID